MPTIPALVKQAFSHWSDAAVLSRTGRELHDRTRFGLAREVLDRALELEPKDWEAWAYRSYCDFRSMRADAGREILRRGVEASGSDRLRTVLASFSDSDEERDSIRSQLETSDDPAVQADLFAHRTYAGDDQAFGRLKEIVASNADDRTIRDGMMWTLMGVRHRGLVENLDLREEGVPLADREIAENPDAIRGHWMKVQMLFAEKDWDAVLDATRAALATHPDDETIIYLRGRAYQEKSDLEHAQQCFLRAIGAKASYGGARTALAKVYEANEQYDLAEEMLREITVANPDYPGGNMGLALFLARREKWDEAERIVLEAWPTMPDWIKGQLMQNPDAKPLMERQAIIDLMPDPDA